jgi:heme-degrading monooxygenase HmoA
MVTIISRQTVSPEDHSAWETAIRERAEGATRQPGFVRGQVLVPMDQPDVRTIIGTWESRADWERFRDSAVYTRTAEQLAGLSSGVEAQWSEALLVY